MVLPYFDYTDVVVSNASAFLLGKLQSLQKRCMHIDLNVEDRNNENDLHNRAGVAKVGDRSEMHVNNFMYRELGRNVPKPKNEMFKRGLHFFGCGSMEQLTSKKRNENSFFSFKS